MPPKKFPSQAEREALMEQLKQAAEKDEGLKASAHYQNYIQALGKLNEQLDGYYQPDEFGAVSALEQEEKDELMTALAETATLGETFLAGVANEGGDLNAGVPDMVGKVQEMLSQDYETLGVYDPKEGEMSLPELQQDARTQVVDLRGVKLGKLGNMQSSRLPMTVVGVTGEKRRGVFTKASHVEVVKPFKEMLKEAAAQCTGKENEETKKKIENLIPNYRAYLAKNKRVKLPGGVKPENASDEMIVGKICQQLMWKQAGVNDILSRSGFDLGKFSGPAKDFLSKKMLQYSEEPAFWVNGLELGLKDGDRLDQRNSAMSAVANLLGMSDMVARSTNMKYIDENDNVVEGTFMEEARGVDLEGNNNLHEYARVADDPLKPPCKLNAPLADLQVLDYLCGNVDRHGGNLFYEVDKDTGKLVGIQAIDNDSSFGLSSSGKNDRTFRIAGTDSLRVVTTDMANKIDKLSPEMLKFTLRGRGLNEAELDAACGRLQDLKTAVREAEPSENPVDLLTKRNTLLIMKPEMLENANFNVLSHDSGNIFKDVGDRIARSLPMARRAGHAYDPKLNEPEAQHKRNMKQVNTLARRYTAAGISQSMRGVENLLYNEVTGFEVSSLSKLFRSSDNYRLMVTEMKNAAKLAKEIKSEIEAGGKETLSRDDKAVEEQRKKADEAMARVERANDAYLAKKLLEKGLDPTKPEDLKQLRGKNDYEQKRIDYALKVRASVQEYKRLNAPEAQAEKDAVASRLEVNRGVSKREIEKQSEELGKKLAQGENKIELQI